MLINCICRKNSCKKNVFFNKLCKNHFLLENNKNIIYIQKLYKGHYVRKKISNIFLKLPNDLQKHIIYYMNINIYYKKYKKKLNLIIENKYKNVINIYSNRLKIDINDIIKSYYIYNKYNSIINSNYLKYLYVLSNDLIIICNFIIDNYYNTLNDYDNYNNMYIINIDLYNRIDNKSNNITEYKKLIDNIYLFKKTYDVNNTLINASYFGS